LKKSKDIISFGDDTIERPYYDTGLMGLNQAVDDSRGIRGGSIVQFVAREGRGKTTLAMQIVAQNQSTAKKIIYEGRPISAAIIDYEVSYDKRYAERQGINTAELIVIQPKTAEQGLDVLEQLLGEGLQLFIVDSISSMVPESEKDKEYSDAIKMAAIGGLLTRAMPRLALLVNHTNALLIMINQYRANFGMGADKKKYGAAALHHHSKIIIELERTKNNDFDARVKAVVSKNKQGAERLVTEYDLIYGKGIDLAAHVIDLALAADIIEQKGSWFIYNGKSVQGKPKARDEFSIVELTNQLRKKYEVR